MFFYLTIEHALNAEKGFFESHRHDRNVFITGLSRISYQLGCQQELGAISLWSACLFLSVCSR